MSHPQVQPGVPHGPSGIELVGPREYVGGLWNELGRLQYEYMLELGLRPDHVLFDVGCGCLRGGIRFIPYLDKRRYFGIDKEPLLVQAGMREVSTDLWAAKHPTLLVSGDFEFHRFHVRADFALAQSLFTHLPLETIETCLSRLRSRMTAAGLFCASFFESPDPVVNRAEPHDWGFFAYTREQLIAAGRRSGWRAEYVGDWNHPRDQRMMHFHAD